MVIVLRRVAVTSDAGNPAAAAGTVDGAHAVGVVAVAPEAVAAVVAVAVLLARAVLVAVAAAASSAASHAAARCPAARSSYGSTAGPAGAASPSTRRRTVPLGSGTARTGAVRASASRWASVRRGAGRAASSRRRAASRWAALPRTAWSRTRVRTATGESPGCRTSSIACLLLVVAAVGEGTAAEGEVTDASPPQSPSRTPPPGRVTEPLCYPRAAVDDPSQARPLVDSTGAKAQVERGFRGR
ncbi:hypothetical protein GCM10028783_21990 [Modestobacter muralis]